MKKRLIGFLIGLLVVFLLVCYAAGRTMQRKTPDPFPVSVANAVLLYEDEICSNADYVETEEEKVYLSVQIYQRQDNLIVVNADSNSAFFDGLQYTVEAEKTLTASDVEVEWLTFMGSAEDSEEDQKCVGDVKIFTDGELISERKINYFSKGIEIVADTVERNSR